MGWRNKLLYFEIFSYETDTIVKFKIKVYIPPSLLKISLYLLSIFYSIENKLALNIT